MSVYIYKNNQQYGPYNIDQIKSWLSSGQVQPIDLACYEGSTKWVPLSTLLSMETYPSAAQPSGYLTGRPRSGWGLIITGAIFAFLGLTLCATLIGAIIGIPMLIIGIPMLIYGRVQYQRRVMWDLKESVRVGVVQGMPAQTHLPPQHYEERTRLPVPSRSLANFCSNCAARLDVDANFCPSCSAPTS